MALSDSAVLREPKLTMIARPLFVEPAHMRVQWDGEFTDGERLAEFAGRLCYMSQENPAHRSTRDYLENMKKQGHGNVLEHASYSLLMEGVSRSLSHEIVRHHPGAAYSELLQRFVNEDATCFVMPPAIMGDASLELAWTAHMDSALSAFTALVEQLMGRYMWVADKVQRRSMARSAARSVLPSSTETKMVVTANARVFRSMLEMSGGENAEWELRRLAVLLLRVLQQEAPAFFSDFEVYAASDRRDAVRLLPHQR